MTKPKTPPTVGNAEHEVAMTTDMPKSEPTELSLPSPGIVHSDVFRTELGALLTQRASGFQRGCIAVSGALEARQQAFDAAIADLTAKYDADRSVLMKQLVDMENGKALADGQLAALDADQQ